MGHRPPQLPMKGRGVDGFFYGLFMDPLVLAGYGIDVADPCRGFVVGYRLQIGQRATLVPAPNARAYGMLITMTHENLDMLYSVPGLEHYRPEAVLAQTLDGRSKAALCYNLFTDLEPIEADADYVEALRAVLRRLAFPAAYIKSIGD